MVIYWFNFKVNRKLWPPQKIFVDSRQERFQLTILSPILLEVSTQPHGHSEQNYETECGPTKNIIILAFRNANSLNPFGVF
jgi:hypothetical protein